MPAPVPRIRRQLFSLTTPVFVERLAGMRRAFILDVNIRALILGHRWRGRQWTLTSGGRAS